jgi:xanthine dehydrogenase accessory factor
VLATVVRCDPPTSARPGDRALVTADGRMRGWIGGGCSEPVVRREALRALAEGTPRMVRIVAGAKVEQVRRPGELTLATTCPSGGSLEVFVEPQLPKPLLVAFGDSPVARALLKMGAVAGFRTCAIHPGAQPGDFEGADLVLSALDLAPARPGPDTWVVVATMGHYDEDALEAALAHPEVDVALVASARRAAAVREALHERGLDEAAVARVRFPAGGTRSASQEEIALLALAGAPAPPSSSAFAADPVCGMVVEVGGGATLEHEGTVLHFCGPACRARFEEEPHRYAGG